MPSQHSAAPEDAGERVFVRRWKNGRAAQYLLILIGTVLPILAPAVGAQEVAGIIYDERTGSALAGSRVSLMDGQLEEISRSVADHAGRFRLSSEASGTFTVVAVAEDYASSGPQEVTLAPGSLRYLILGLRPLPGVPAQVDSAKTSGRGPIIFGRVMSDGEPIEGAIVTVLHQRGEDTAVTSSTGRFSLETTASGRAEIAIQHIAFGRNAGSLDLAPGLAHEITANLVPHPLPVEGIHVTVRARSEVLPLIPVYERMERGLGGYFVTRQELERSGHIPVAEAIAKLPSMKVRRMPDGNYIVQTRRAALLRGDLRTPGCTPMLYVDGVPAHRPGQPPTDLYSLSSSQIEIIEVYPGASSVPPDYARPGAMCVVAIWTRRGR